jgi:hypothetical protein
MSETLTMDETPADQPELTPEEQDSLQVGEAIASQEETLLAGKYKNAEELEKAHLALQKKLGERKPEQNEEPVNEVPKQEEVTEEKETKKQPSKSKVLESLWDQRANGKFSEESLKALKESNPGELAKEYLNYRQANEPKGLTDKDVADLKNIAGGPEKYDQIVDWATKNLSQKEQQMYDTVVDRGDPLACYFALQTVMAKYEGAVGVEGKMITGKPPTQSGNVFRSQAELVAAMADPRYENDPAYRQDIIQKLDRSGVNF